MFLLSDGVGPVSAIWCQTLWHWVSLIAHPMVPSVVCINIGKYNIFCGPDEAILYVMVKACLHSKIMLLFRTNVNFVFHVYGFKHNEKSSFTSSKECDHGILQ